MLLVVRRLQELGQRRRNTLYMCFDDFQKAYNAIDRELLLQVLARAGILDMVTLVIHQFHGTMPGRERMDDGQLSEFEGPHRDYGKDVCCLRCCPTFYSQQLSG